jgi:hypothetical protein
MKLTDVLQRDPAHHPLVNQGQARIADKTTDKALEELRGELSTFVCEGQFADGLQRILSSFLASLNQTNQKAAWVSGFFGSGKSHLLKMACHLWQDTRFPDGATARSLVPSLPEELRNLLRELDTAGKRSGGLLAAAGALPSGSTDNVRLTVLGILFRGLDLPEQYPQAMFSLWLYEQGWFDRVKSSIEQAGKNWASELNNLYVSGLIARAVLQCDRTFAANEVDARKAIREQFPQRTTDITTEQFLTAFRRALKLRSSNGRWPCTLLVLDEVQQYIGDSNDRSTMITEVAEAICKQLDSHVMIVAAGQRALTESKYLQKLLDRFTVRVGLNDTDVETVTRKVLLQKKPSAIPQIGQFLDAHGGEISRQLQGTRIGETASDRETIIDDYPLLPVRRRFWEQCFRQVDAAGTQSQLRSQLRIIHDAVVRLSDKELGAVVPGDDLFEALAPEMVNTGVLLHELNERIINLSRDGAEASRLARRICGLVFLISKLPRQDGVDIGVRATKEHLADLLVDNLAADNGKLRAAVESALNDLESRGVLMKVGEEYRLQTKEGAEWDREFRNRQTQLANDDAEVQVLRDTLLYAEVDRIVHTVKLIQGASKEARHLGIHRDQMPPQATGDSVPVWIRDGWSCSEKEHLGTARTAGTDSPMLFVFIPRQSADDVRRLIIEAEAAAKTLSKRGEPAADDNEGQEAKRSMESRRDCATSRRDELARQIVAHAKVFQGGGTELLQGSLQERLQGGANDSLVRLFPRFNEADSAAWGTVVRRAREGAEQPFQPVGHQAATEQHPVSQQVLSTIGAGKSGGEVRKALRSSPFGWPQDAIDAALVALHRSQHLSVTLNGSAVKPGQLDQAKIGKAEFRKEKVTLSVKDRLALRKLFQAALGSCKAGEESALAGDFLEAALALAKSTGGDAPLPPAPSVKDVEDLRRLVGNDQLKAIRDKASDLEVRIAGWKKTKELVGTRLPAWTLLDRLAKHAAGLAEAAPHLGQVDAIREQRLLLQATDPVAPVRVALSGTLRKAVQEAHDGHLAAYQAGMASLAANQTWGKLQESRQTGILASVGLVEPQAPDLATDQTILGGLEAQPLPARRTETDAVTGRVMKAIQEAAKLLEPEVQAVTVERATLRNPDDVHTWLARQEETLLEAVKNGPVLIQ